MENKIYKLKKHIELILKDIPDTKIEFWTKEYNENCDEINYFYNLLKNNKCFYKEIDKNELSETSIYAWLDYFNGNNYGRLINYSFESLEDLKQQDMECECIDGIGEANIIIDLDDSKITIDFEGEFFETELLFQTGQSYVYQDYINNLMEWIDIVANEKTFYVVLIDDKLQIVKSVLFNRENILQLKSEVFSTEAESFSIISIF